MFALVPFGQWIAGAAVALTVISAPLASVTLSSTAPAPQVLAWASFLDTDRTITTTTPWSSGPVWDPLVGNWAQAGNAAVTTRSSANARAVAVLPDAGSTARVVAKVSSRDGTPVHSGGVVAAAATGGTRVALAALVGTDGSLQIRRVAGGGGSTTLLASSASFVTDESAVELTLQLVDGVATATLRPLNSVTPSVVVEATLTAGQHAELVDNTGYGVLSHSTTNVALQALRVEFPS